MKEVKLRKVHRHLGEVLILFLGLQVVTALIISLARLDILPFGGFVFFARNLHLGGGFYGEIYRLALGAVVLLHVLTGAILSLLIRRRQKRTIHTS